MKKIEIKTLLLWIGVASLISFLVISKLIFDHQLIGRSMDFAIPALPDLIKNVYLMDIFSWWGSANFGASNAFSATLLPISSLLYFPLIFRAGAWFIARYQIFLSIFLGLFFFMLLARRLLADYVIKEKWKYVIVIFSAIYFVLNNFYFCEIIFGSNVMFLSFSFFPLLLYALISLFKSRNTAYMILALVALIFVSSTLQYMALAYLLIILFAFFYRQWKYPLLLIGLHLLISAYWLIPLFYTISSISSVELATDYTAGLTNSSSNFVSTLINSDYFGNRDLYKLALGHPSLAVVWTINAFFLVSTALVSLFKISFYEKNARKLILISGLIVVVSLLFIKGGNEPFGSIVLDLYKKIPIFNLFRSLQHYIALYVIGISMLLLYSTIFVLKRYPRFFWLLPVLVLINAMPWFTLDVGTGNIKRSETIPSHLGLYNLSEDDRKIYEINNRPLDFSYLTIPPGFSINFINEDGTKLQGGDADLSYGNKRFIASEISGPMKALNDKIEKSMYTDSDFFNNNKNLFALLNLKYFALRTKTEPVYSKFAALFDISNIETAIGKSRIFGIVENYGVNRLFENKYFLQHIYAPKKIVGSDQNISHLPEISRNNGEIRSAVLFEGQNQNTKLQEALEAKGSPALEFKRISPVKYRVIAHQAKEPFLLVFGDSFSHGWKIYPTNSYQKNEIPSQTIDNYKGFGENTNDQATIPELRSYLDQGLISAVNEDKFISKNYEGSIQNDSLPNGAIWENRQKKATAEKNHFIVNGYANAWLISPGEICSNNSAICSSDSSELELVIEYYPQKLFYIGIVVSALTLISLTIGLIIIYKRKNVQKS